MTFKLPSCYAQLIYMNTSYTQYNLDPFVNNYNRKCMSNESLDFVNQLLYCDAMERNKLLINDTCISNHCEYCGNRKLDCENRNKKAQNKATTNVMDVREQ
eukprot:954540_1